MLDEYCGYDEYSFHADEYETSDKSDYPLNVGYKFIPRREEYILSTLHSHPKNIDYDDIRDGLYCEFIDRYNNNNYDYFPSKYDIEFLRIIDDHNIFYGIKEMNIKNIKMIESYEINKYKEEIVEILHTKIEEIRNEALLIAKDPRMTFYEKQQIVVSTIDSRHPLSLILDDPMNIQLVERTEYFEEYIKMYESSISEYEDYINDKKHNYVSPRFVSIKTMKEKYISPDFVQYEFNSSECEIMRAYYIYYNILRLGNIPEDIMSIIASYL